MKTKALFFFLLLVAAFLLYFPSLSIGFLSDDWHALLVARDGGSWWHFFATNIVGTRQGSSYGPLWNILINIEYHLFHLHAAWYHAVSLFLLVGASFTVYLFISRVLSKQAVGILAALLFIVLPSHVEAVAWISGQPHLLATFLYILSLYLYLLFVQTERKRWYGLALLAFLASLLTKEIGITGIVGFALVDLFFNSWRRLQWLVARLAPVVGLVCAYILLRQFATGAGTGYYGAASILVDPYHFIRMFVEMTVNLFVSWPQRIWIMETVSTHLPLAFGFLTAAAVIGWHLARFKKLWLWAVCMYLAALLPYLPLMYNPLNSEGERYTYLSSLFAVMIAALVLDEIFSRVRVARPLFGACVCVMLMVAGAAIQGKLASWRLASAAVQAALSRVEVYENQKVVAIGLPDTLDGAQMLRNGFGEALTLLDKPFVSVERIPMFIRLSPETVQSNLVEVHSENGVLTWASKQDRIFTGFARYETNSGVWALRDWRVSDQTGTAMVFTPITSATSSTVLYWNNGDLTEVSRK